MQRNHGRALARVLLGQPGQDWLRRIARSRWKAVNPYSMSDSALASRAASLEVPSTELIRVMPQRVADSTST